MKPALLLPVTIDSTNNKLYLTQNALSLVTITVPAGTYFHVFDNDITTSLPAKIQSLIQAEGRFYRVRIIDGKYKILHESLGATFQLNAGANSIYSELGITSAQLDATMDYTLTATYQHGNGWYADHPACLSGLPERGNQYNPIVKQTVSIAGDVVTRYYNKLESRNISLRWLSKAKTYAQGATVYGDFTTLNRPTVTNEAFELFWRSAINGKRFRFYRDYDPPALARHTTSTRDATTITVSAPTIDGNSKYYGFTASLDSSTPVNDDRVIITSNTSTVITFSGGWVTIPTGLNHAYYIKDFRYDTYVLDKETIFSPTRMFNDQEDLFEINFNCWKYIA